MVTTESETTVVGIHHNGVNTSLGEVVLVRAKTLVQFRQRREELRAIAKDALVYLQTEGTERTVYASDLEALWNKVNEALGLERVRVPVEVIGDNHELLSSCEQRRRDEIRRFLHLNRGLLFPGGPDERSGVKRFQKAIGRVSLRANETVTFQLALHVWCVRYMFVLVFSEVMDGEDDVQKVVKVLAELRAHFTSLLAGPEEDFFLGYIAHYIAEVAIRAQETKGDEMGTSSGDITSRD